MPADLSWIDGSVEDAAKLIADRAVASRALGGAVAPGETPAWAADLEKAAAAAEKEAAGLGEYWDRFRAAAGEAVNAPGARGAVTGGLIGAGGGAALGLGANLLSSNRRKRPLSNAVFGGLLGGLGGAAVGGLAGTVGEAAAPRPPSNAGKLSDQIAARDDVMRDAPNFSADKAVAGLNGLSAGGLARGAGYGAAAGAGADVAARSLVRGLNPLTRKETVNPAAVRSYLSPTQQAGLAALPPKADTAAVRAAVGGSFDPIRTTFRTKGNDVLKGIHGAGDDALAKALTRGATGRVAATPAWRPWLAGRSTLGLAGAGAALGTAAAGTARGMEMANSDAARTKYLYETAADLRTRFPHVGADPADTAGAALRQKLTAAINELNGVGPGKALAPDRLTALQTLLNGGGTGDERETLHNRFRDVELGIKPGR